MKILAFTIGLCIAAIGVVGMFAPSELVWIAQHAGTSGAFYVIAVIRIAVGLVLISVASASRSPKGLRILGYVVLSAGIVTALMALVGIERARAIIDWWLQQGPGAIRAAGVILVVIGGYIAYACAPVQRRTA